MRDHVHPSRVSAPSGIVLPHEDIIIKPYLVPLLPTFHGMESENVVTPEPSPTRLVSPNRNPEDARLFLFFFRVIKFSFSKMSRPESLTRPKWRIRTGARFTPTFSFILSKHFIMSFRCGSGFSFGQAHNHLQIQCNSVGP